MKYFATLIFLSHLSSAAFAVCWDASVNEATNIRECKRLADKGDPEAQANLGESYYAGTGVEKDHKKALELFKKSASTKWMGMLDAHFDVAKVYSQGDENIRDYSQALYWYTKAAEAGDGSSQQNIGSLYYVGSGVNKDFVKAYMWFTIAIQNNSKVRLERITKQMSQQQINEALQLADKWISDHPCGIYSEECMSAMMDK